MSENLKPTHAMLILASQLDRSKKEFFSFERVSEAMVRVIKESSDGEKRGARNYVRAHTAALLAVYMQDERQRAEKDGCRRGYSMLLNHLERVATARVYKYDPDGSWITRQFPDAAARLMTPTKVFEAQAEIEISEAPEKAAKKAAKEARKAKERGERAEAEGVEHHRVEVHHETIDVKEKVETAEPAKKKAANG